QISIVGFSGFISKSYVSPFLARVAASHPRADFIRNAAALECGGSTPLWEQGILSANWSTSEIPNLSPNKSDHTCHLRLTAVRIRTMKTFTSCITILFATLIALPSLAQNTAQSPATATGAVTAPSGQPNPQEMMKQMMELSKLNENHKLLADMNGNWN